MAGSWGAENTILTNDEFLDAISCTDFGDELCDLGVPVSAVATNDQSAVLNALRDGEEDAGDERFRVVGLLKDLDLLSQAGAVVLSVNWALKGARLRARPRWWRWTCLIDWPLHNHTNGA